MTSRPFSAERHQVREALVTGASNNANNLVDFFKATNGKTIKSRQFLVSVPDRISRPNIFLKFLAHEPAQVIPFQGRRVAGDQCDDSGNQVDLMASTLGGGAAAQIAGAANLKVSALPPNIAPRSHPMYRPYAEQGFQGFTTSLMG